MTLPKEIQDVLEKLELNDFEASIVGGCVRDLLMAKAPGDWDITTNARPEEIQKIFPDSFYENQFGTVGVKTESSEPALKVIEVTTYRIESKYSDKRHPDEIKFATRLEDDLKRRDFTVNAMAMDRNGKLVDLFSGQADLKNKIIRAVGRASERFNEDALRMMRAVRFATALGFTIEPETLTEIKKNHQLLQVISKERVRDELGKVIETERADEGFEIFRQTGLIKHIIPELLEGVGVTQNKHHIYTVWEHNARALGYACRKKYSLEVKLAALLHDVGKPRTKKGDGLDVTFYGHEIVGARMTSQILDRLRFPKIQAEKIIRLVRYHLFYYNPGEVTESSVRRLMANIGRENVEDLIKVREADRIGSGVPKAKPYRLRHLQFMIEKVGRDPISPRMLKLNGSDIMRLVGILPGPRVGMIINALMNEVLDDPAKNSGAYLERRVKELNALSETELSKLAKVGKTKVGEEEEKEVKMIKEKYYVS